MLHDNYALYCGTKCNKQRWWVPAVVTKVFSTQMVNVCVVAKGWTWRQHIDQLHPCYRVNEDADPGEDPRPTLLDTQVSSRGQISLDQSNHPHDVEGTNTTDDIPTPNPSESTDCPSTKKTASLRCRKVRPPSPGADHGPHNPRCLKRLQATK